MFVCSWAGPALCARSWTNQRVLAVRCAEGTGQRVTRCLTSTSRTSRRVLRIQQEDLALLQYEQVTVLGFLKSLQSDDKFIPKFDVTVITETYHNIWLLCGDHRLYVDVVTVTSPLGLWTAVLKPRVRHFGHRHPGLLQPEVTRGGGAKYNRMLKLEMFIIEVIVVLYIYLHEETPLNLMQLSTTPSLTKASMLDHILELKGNFGIFQPGPYFPMFLCLTE